MSEPWKENARVLGEELFGRIKTYLKNTTEADREFAHRMGELLARTHFSILKTKGLMKIAGEEDPEKLTTLKMDLEAYERDLEFVETQIRTHARGRYLDIFATGSDFLSDFIGGVSRILKGLDLKGLLLDEAIKKLLGE